MPPREPRPIARAYTAREVAEVLGISINTVKRLSPGKLPFFRVGERGDRRYEVAAVERYKKDRYVNS